MNQYILNAVKRVCCVILPICFTNQYLWCNEADRLPFRTPITWDHQDAVSAHMAKVRRLELGVFLIFVKMISILHLIQIQWVCIMESKLVWFFVCCCSRSYKFLQYILQ